MTDFTQTIAQIKADLTTRLSEALREMSRDVPDRDTALRTLAGHIVAGDSSHLPAVRIEEERLFEAGPVLSILGFDLPSIHGWVLDTGRPAIIRGGSMRLSETNREVSELGKKHGIAVVFSGGGQGTVLCSYKKRDEVKRKIKQIFHEKLHESADVVVGILDVRCEDLIKGFSMGDVPKEAKVFLGLAESKNAEGFGTFRQPLAAVMAAQRDVKGAKHPATERCSHCGIRPGIKDENRSWNQRHGLICTRCSIRRDHVKALGGEFEQQMDFSEISNRGGRRSKYHGLVYGDGLNVGGLVDSMRTPLQFAVFSEVLDRSMKLAPVILKQMGLDPERYLQILDGGDDMLIVMPACEAFEFALKFSKQVEEQLTALSHESLFTEASNLAVSENLNRCGMGIGIVLCKEAFPIRIGVQLADELMRGSKIRARESQKSKSIRSTLDFIAITGSSPITLRERPERIPRNGMGEKQLKTRAGEELFWLTGRPFALEEADRLYREVAVIADLARSQLYSFRGLVDGSPDELDMQIKYQAGRFDKVWNKLAKALWELHYPDNEKEYNFTDGVNLCSWRESPRNKTDKVTPVLDWIELASFINREVTNE